MKRDAGKIKTEFLILGLVIVALSAMLIVRNQDHVGYDLPEISALDKDAVDRVEVTTGKNTLVMERSNKSWRMRKSGYKVDEDKIAQVLSTLADLKISTLVSQSGDYRRYGLDPDASISVRAFSGKREVRSLVIGKVVSSYRHTFVRFPDTKGVYHADESIRSRFEYSDSDWRDKKILRFETDEISSFSVTLGEKIATFTRSLPAPPAPVDGTSQPEAKAPGDAVIWKSDTLGLAPVKEVDALLTSLSNLSCQGFTPDRLKSTIDADALKITLRGNQEYILSVAREKDGESEIFPAYSATTSESFTLEPYTARELIRKAEALFNREEVDAVKKQPLK